MFPHAFGIPQGGGLIVIVFVVLLLFGAKKLPELARGMGKAINEFKKASHDIETEFKQSLEDTKPEPKKVKKVKVEKKEEKQDETEYTHAKAAANNESN